MNGTGLGGEAAAGVEDPMAAPRTAAIRSVPFIPPLTLIADMRPVNLATPVLDPFHRRAVDPRCVASLDTYADIREVRPQSVEGLSLINREMCVTSRIHDLTQSLCPRSEVILCLIDVGSNVVGLCLDLSDCPIVIRLQELEAKPVDLSNQLPVLRFEPLTHFTLRGDVGIRDILAVSVVWERKLRRPTAWTGSNSR